MSAGILGAIDEVHLEVTPRCNLRCAYCFVGSATEAGPEPRFMRLDTASRVFARVFSATRRSEVSVTFHGGEPMLQEPEWFAEVCEVGTGCAAQHRKQVSFSMQSNGTLLRDDLLGVLRQYRIKVGLSVDGVAEVHDVTRGSHAATVRALDLLAREGLLGGAIAVLTRISAPRLLEFLAFLEDRGVRRVSLNEFYASGRGVRDQGIGAEELFASWCTVLGWMLDHEGRGVCDRNTLDRVNRFLNPSELSAPANCTTPFCHAGFKMIHVSASGEIFPCGTAAWIQNGRFLLGQVGGETEQAAWRWALRDLHRKDARYEQVCRRCPAALICSFGCSAFEKVDPAGKDALCRATQRFFVHLRGVSRDRLVSLLANTQSMRLRN